MEDNTMNSFEFDIPAHHKSIIKVIGVGGGGSNAYKAARYPVNYRLEPH
jgi:cell division GTPase FtsZ